VRTLWDPPPGIQASDSRSTARRPAVSRKTVLGNQGSLRRGKLRRALVSCAPFCPPIDRDGRLRREPDAEQFLRLAKDENQMAVDKTS
jgi:hypothetical protein